VALVDPAVDGTDTYVGIWLERFTGHPPAGAAELRVIVPVLPPPPATVDGFSVKLDIESPAMVRVAVLLEVASVAVIVLVYVSRKGRVVAVKVPEVEPAGITMDDGTPT
jgi:hypothetical protein